MHSSELPAESCHAERRSHGWGSDGLTERSGRWGAGTSTTRSVLTSRACSAPCEPNRPLCPPAPFLTAVRCRLPVAVARRDQGVGNVTAALTAKEMMEDIIIVFTADNGGPTTTGDAVGSRNFPLKGGKHTIW